MADIVGASQPQYALPNTPQARNVYATSQANLYPLGNNATGGAGGAGQDQMNIDYLLNPYTALPETQMRAAEANLGAGTSGSGFASGTTNRLLDSERIARMQLGHQLLEPYLQRDFQAQQAAADRLARLQEIQAQGAQALQQLQLSEAGQTARLTQEEQSQLQRQVLAGQQAVQQIRIQQAGETGRLGQSIRGNILNTLIGAAIQRPTSTTAAGYVTPRYVSDFDWASQTSTLRPAATTPPRTTTTTGGIGLNTIDTILRRYGLA